MLLKYQQFYCTRHQYDYTINNFHWPFSSSQCKLFWNKECARISIINVRSFLGFYSNPDIHSDVDHYFTFLSIRSYIFVGLNWFYCEFRALSIFIPTETMMLCFLILCPVFSEEWGSFVLPEFAEFQLPMSTLYANRECWELYFSIFWKVTRLLSCFSANRSWAIIVLL